MSKTIEISVYDLEDMEKEIKTLKEENRKLKESLDIATKCSSKEEDWIIRLSEENKKLKDELEFYKKQYEHTTWDYIEEDLYDLDC